ncbi:uncharacterized protein LOC128616285 [Ictalurus furcatus]|uniref:uncharacterized protein LOC128616285 n=1 Tax=Ictalurus furcatus TaxID=66913 RepID=UPI002350D3CD|nr:uncharacterized protein LOC128616285 [Ictalurus furcatus]
MASSHQSAREYIRDACENLVGRLQNLPLIVEKLHQQNVLNGNEVGDLEDEPENCRKTRKILDWVINKGEEACYKFLRILDCERKSVLPKPDSSSLTPDLHTWICLFSFRDEPEDDYTQGPSSCHQLQKILKTRTKESLGEQWRQSQQFYGGKVQENFTFIPLVLDTDTEKNTPHNKIILKSKKSKKSRSKKMRAYIPKDTQRKSPEDLLNSEEKSILIVGKPGIGKTTVVQQMLHHWAERHDRNLDFMFYFDENTLSNTSTIVSLEHLLLQTVLMSNPQLKDNVEEILHYLQEYSERVTIIFDGIRDFPDNAFLLGIIQHDLLPEAKVVATCRPEVEYEFSDWTTCKVYVHGFSEESINDFFRTMSDNDPEMVDSVINNPALFSLCHVPMYAFMVAACILNDTSEQAQKQCTASELYVRIFCQCLQRHGKNKLLHLDGHIKNCRDMVLSLAESAFNAIKLKTIILEIDYDEKDIAGAFLKTVSVVSPARAKTFCAFPHNTMQEFFSALWLLEKTEILDKVLHLCQNEDSKHMKHVIPFLCGLQSHTNIDHLKCLFPLNKVMENIDSFFEKVLNTFLCDQPDDEKVDVAFICQCLYEYQSPETCCSFLERINYYLDLSEERLGPYTCCAVSYVISQSRNKQVHLDLENGAVSLSGLKTVLDHSQYLRDLSATLCQVWTIALKCEELNYLIHLLQLCGNEIHIPVSSQTDVLRQAGKIITQYAEQTNLHLHCDKDPRQFSDLLFSTVFTWLPHISSLQFDSKQGEKEREERCRTFLLDLCLQAALHQPHNIQETVEKVMTFYYNEQSDFLLDLYSRVKQYESETGRRVLPALLPVYQSGPAVWSIKLSERKVSLLLEVLKLQTEKKPVELRDCSDEESEVRSFLQCLPYISHLRFKRFDSKQGEKEREKRCRTFKLDLCLQAALHQPHNILETVEKVMPDIEDIEDEDNYYEVKSDFLLDLYSRVKQYESETGRRVLPALLPVYQSGPAVWSIKLSERKVSLLLEVLKLQTEKKPVELRDWSDEESEVRSFLQCLPYISHLRFDSKQGEKEREERCRTFLLDLCLQAALHQPHNILQTVEKVMTIYYYYYYYEVKSDFLLDLYSRVKQYESETGRRVLPALLPVYQSGPAVWSIKLSERKVSLLLEVLKLQTEKKPVELRDCSDEESEVRSFLQCLPYISHLSFKRFDSKQGEKEREERCRTFLLDLCLQAALHQPHNILQTVEKVMTIFYYYYYEQQSDFLLDLYSRVKQYESETGRRVLPALLPVYQSVPAVWSIKLSERKVSLLLEVLKLQTEKKPVQLRDWSDEESEVRSFLQCLPYISHLRFKRFDSDSESTASIQFLLNLSIAAVDCKSDKGESFTELLASACSYNTFPFGEVYRLQEQQSDFLLDLYSRVKQYESETGRRVLPALLPVYQSGPAVWYIKLSERKVSLLLEVLKLQTEKKPVELRDCSDEESEVRSFLQCLPYISHLRFKRFDSDSESTASIQFLLNLSIAAVDCKSDKGESFTELLASACSYNTFPFGEVYRLQEQQSDFLLDLYSRVKQYESETGRRVLPALLPVYQSGPAVWSIKLSERKVSLLLEVLKLQTEKKPVELRDWSDEESEVRSFLQCLPYISHLRFKRFDSDSESTASIQFLLNLSIAAVDCKSDKGESFTELLASACSYNTFPFGEVYRLQEQQSDFLLDLYSRVKQYESETGRRVLPALLPVYQSGPAVWSIKLSERKVSLLLEVLKLQTEKKPVELRDCSDEESEVRSFLKCLPYISHLRFDSDSESTASIQFLLNLSIAAVDCKSDKGESFTELLASVCSYNTFPFDEEFDEFQEQQRDFLLDLYSRVKQYESETGRRVLPALLPVYQSVPAVWSIKLSERKVSLLLEVLKLQTEKKPVELRDCSDEESEVRSFLQCLPYISELRCGENIIPRLSKAVVDCTEDTELVRAFFAAVDFIFIIDWVLTTRECRAVRKVLRLSDSKLKLTLKPRAISLRGARLLFRHITHLQKLCLSDRVVGRMVRAFGAVRAGGSLVIEELCLSLNSINPKKEIFTFLSSLSSLLNIWTVHCVNLTECRMEAHSLISLMCHPGNLKIRLSKETLQQFTSLLCEVQDGELTRFFLEKVGGDLTSCSLSWEELIHFLQQRVCRISANIRKSKITYNHIRQILPLLSEIQFKRLNPSVVLSIIREIYETGSAHCVSSLLRSTHSCINLNNTELDSYHCTALCFTLQHCTSVSLSLLWTSIPEGELVKILSLFNGVSQLSVDRVLLLKLLHCCSISELQQGAAAAVFSALQNRLDFSCSTGLDLSTETQDNTLHLTTEDCRDISTAIQQSLQLTELNLKDCEMEDTGVDMFFLILHTVKLRCSKTLLLRFLARLQVVNELDCVRHAMYLSQALDGEMDLSKTPLDLPACRSLALFLEFSEGLSELDLSHCQLADHSLEVLFPHLHKAAVLDLSHNGIDDCLAGRIYTVVSTSSNIQTVRLFNNRITDIEPFRKDKRFEVW